MAGIGVEGHSDDGTGVRGDSGNGRGGMFSSQRAAQVRLIPHAAATIFPPPLPLTPYAIPAAPEVVPLPRSGQGGDLLTIQDKSGECTLWFCVRGEDKVPARWAQVLLGASYEGTF